MKKYSCVVIDEEGQSSKKIIEADNELELLQKNKQNDFLTVSFDEITQDKVIIQKLSIKELIIFCRQLSIMLESGITVVNAIDILEKKSEKSRTRQIYSQIYESLQKGNSLSGAMEEQGVFPLMLINMVRNGEAGGVLEGNLAKMADHFEKENRLKNKVQGAMMYPMILCFVATAVVLFLMTVIMPQFLAMYENYDTLPWPTVVVMGFSNFLTHNWLYILFAIGFIILGVQAALKVHSVKYAVDNVKLNMPILGRLNRTVYSSNCARSFATLYASGVQMIDIINMTAKLIGNTVIEDGFTSVVQKVSRGELISTALQELEVFDPMFISMVYIGEESGSLDSILNKAADYFDEEADSATQKMVSMLEPAMIVVLGIIVGFIIIAIMLPMYGAMNSI